MDKHTEKYEDALFRLLMEPVAEEQGRADLAAAEQAPEVPASLDEKCRALIEGNPRRRTRRFPAWAAVAAAVLVLAAVAWVAFPGLRGQSNGNSETGQPVTQVSDDGEDGTVIKDKLPQYPEIHDVVPERPVLPVSNRNLPPSGGAAETPDGKWVVAFTTDSDVDTALISPGVYDCCVISREPMDPNTIKLTTDAGQELRCWVNDVTEYELHNEGLPQWLWLAYNGVDSETYAQWEKYMLASAGLGHLGDFTPEQRARFKEISALLHMSEGPLKYQSAEAPSLYLYQVAFSLADFKEETVIRRLVFSWPGTEQAVDIGELRIHPGGGWNDPVEWDPVGFPDWGDQGSVLTTFTYPFGPELGRTDCTLTPSEDVTIRRVSFRDPGQEIVEMRLVNEDGHVMPVPEEGGVTIPAGQTWTLQVFIASEHFSALHPFGVRWLRIEYTCASGSGVLTYEAHDWSDIRSVELCAMLMDNVDEQEHFESLYNPYAEDGYFHKSVLDKIGWTDYWNAAYGE